MRPTVENTTACLVTRGNVDLAPILNSLPYRHVIVWDNSKRENRGIYGRYAAAAEARTPFVYVQDDDLICHAHHDLIAAYQPGRMVVNYHQPWDIPWNARGGIFPRHLPGRVFAEYFAVYPNDDTFRRYLCDGILSLLAPPVVVEGGYEGLPWENEPGRVSTSGGWYDHHRPMIQERAAAVIARRDSKGAAA